MRVIAKLGLLGISLFAPVIAQATPITVTATGTVITSNDDTNYFGLGAGANTLNGAFITASWTFDTDDAGTDSHSGNSTLAEYRPQIDWITSTIDIDTTTADWSIVTGDIDDDEEEYFDLIQMQNEYGGLGGRDRYFITDYDYTSDSAGTTIVYSQAYIESFVNNLISDFDVSQTFSWTAGDSNDVGWGAFSYSDTATSPEISSGFTYRLDTFTVAASNVPEPSTLVLMGLGLAGLRVRRRK